MCQAIFPHPVIAVVDLVRRALKHASRHQHEVDVRRKADLASEKHTARHNDPRIGVLPCPWAARIASDGEIEKRM